MVRLRKREPTADRLVFLIISPTLLSRCSLRMLNEVCVEAREQLTLLSALVPIPPLILESNLIKIDALV